MNHNGHKATIDKEAIQFLPQGHKVILCPIQKHLGCIKMGQHYSIILRKALDRRNIFRLKLMRLSLKQQLQVSQYLSHIVLKSLYNSGKNKLRNLTTLTFDNFLKPFDY